MTIKCPKGNGDLTLDMTGLHNRVKEFPAHSVENVEEIDLVVQHSTYTYSP